MIAIFRVRTLVEVTCGLDSADPNGDDALVISKPLEIGVSQMVTIAVMGVVAFFASLPTRSTYATVVYTAPFVVLALFAIRSKALFYSQEVAAAVGAAIPIALFHCLFLYDIWVRLPNEGGGANIGLGILLVFLMPIIVPISMIVGWMVGRAIQKYASVS